MKIKNKPLFILFLLLTAVVDIVTCYLNIRSQSLNLLPSVIAFFAPLPMLWQTNVNEYTGKTAIGKRISNESEGTGVFLGLHAFLLLFIWAIGIFFVDREGGISALIVFLIFVLIVLGTFWGVISVDKKAKEYASLPSQELLKKVISGQKTASVGMTLMIVGSAAMLVLVIAGIFNFITLDMFFVACIYWPAILAVGLLVFCFGWIKGGVVSRALNMYCKRPLEPWEREYVQNRLSVETAAQEVRNEQILGQVAGDNIIGNILKAKGTVDSVPVIKKMSLSFSKWTCTATIIGFILAEVIYAFCR